MTTAAYVRVSSKSQDDATQRDSIVRAIGTDDIIWYSEKASAKTTQRPVLRDLLADARARRFDRLVVFRLDRLTRTGVADTFALIAELRSSRITLVSVSDRLTVCPTEGDITSDVLVFALGLAAKIERAAINERISAARVRVEHEGGAWGRPPKMTPRQIASARRMRDDGRTIREIAKALGIPKSTVGAATKIA